jgi:transposase
VSDWPPQSPDLNPIENLWGLMSRKMRTAVDAKPDAVRAEILRVWAETPAAVIQSLCRSFPARCYDTFLAVGSNSTHY